MQITMAIQNFNNKPDNALLSNNNEINNSFQAQEKRVPKKQALKEQSSYKRNFEDVFTGIGCFDGTFSLQVKLDSKPYQVPPWCIAYEIQKPFMKELGRLQQQDIITPLS